MEHFSMVPTGRFGDTPDVVDAGSWTSVTNTLLRNFITDQVLCNSHNQVSGAINGTERVRKNSQREYLKPSGYVATFSAKDELGNYYIQALSNSGREMVAHQLR